MHYMVGWIKRETIQMDNPNLNEIARREAERLIELPATVSVNGAIIKLVQPGRVFVAECTDEDSFLVGYEEPPTSGGFPVRVLTLPRVKVSRSEMVARANQWARVGT